jgi:hypothetical protein
MTVLQGALESGAPAPGGGGEQISMIWARTRPWPAQSLCAPNRSGTDERSGIDAVLTLRRSGSRARWSAAAPGGVLGSRTAPWRL